MSSFWKRAAAGWIVRIRYLVIKRGVGNWGYLVEC
jgi:hypothetical protein